MTGKKTMYTFLQSHLFAVYISQPHSKSLVSCAHSKGPQTALKGVGDERISVSPKAPASPAERLWSLCC